MNLKSTAKTVHVVGELVTTPRRGDRYGFEFQTARGWLCQDWAFAQTWRSVKRQKGDAMQRFSSAQQSEREGQCWGEGRNVSACRLLLRVCG